MPDLLPNAQFADHRQLIHATDFFTNTHTLELYTAAMKLAWGAWNLFWWALPYQDLARVPIFGVLQQLAPQWLWGLTGMFLGGCHLLTPIRMLRLRMFWLFFAFVFWSVTVLPAEAGELSTTAGSSGCADSGCVTGQPQLQRDSVRR